MQIIGDKSNESPLQHPQQQQQQQQQQNKEEQHNTHDVLQAKMHKFYPPKPKISAFNDLFACYLCRGYMINPTAIDVCMHTYCRSCIVRHLAADCYCPQCKVSSGGKAITIANLKSDDILRSIIYKLVPGLYQKERERLVQFVKNTKNEGNLITSTSTTTSTTTSISIEQCLNELLETDDDFFSPTEPISLSLEFHPVLAEQCHDGAVPPVRYLQCPASVKVQHLKRFLCSKFNIDPCNTRVGIDIIYEDEILRSDFTLMDVGYCYQWQRHAPLKLTYRIVIYNEDMSVSNDCDSEVKKSVPDVPTSTKTVSMTSHNGEETLVTAPPTLSSPPQEQISKSSNKSSAVSRQSLSTHPEVPVKVTISRKSSENKKTVSKKSSCATDEFVVPTTTTNDFKSLRSNDIRYSNYTITSTTTPNTANSSVPPVKKEKLTVKEEKPAKCDIVVSIPHTQMQDEWDSKPLSELKTASKKSPNSTGTEVTKTTPAPPPPAKKNRNVPKLKIELNSLKTKLIEKPKSADIRLDTLMLKQHRPRKFSLDEPQPVVDKVDLETYVKNIGLKPIEIQTNNSPETPNASPMSSSSSTTSSSTGNFNFNGSADITSSSSSSHKKRKKKHSKNSRESKDSKRKKLHAEISSHSAEESLKMKVKLTPPINLKALKLESKKSPSLNIVERATDTLKADKSKAAVAKLESNDVDTPKSLLLDKPKDKSKSHIIEAKKSKPLEDNSSQQASKKVKDLEDKTSRFETKLALSTSSSKTLTKEFDDDEDLNIPDSTSAGLNKPLVSMKEAPLPQSPPLPPSLFKTTTLTFPPFSPNITSVAKPKTVVMPKDSKDKPRTPQIKPIAPKPMAPKLLQPSTFKSPQFAVPNTPSRFMASNTTKFLSTPTSIASAANKHFGNLLKRSISLDEHKNSGSQNKQPRLEKPSQITVSAYGSNLHMTKVEIPATPTSSTAKATYEIPLYSPLSASYNPKCSFTVNSTTTAVVKTTKGSSQPNSLSSTTTSPTTSLKPNKQTECKKTTTNLNKSSDATSNSHVAKCKPTGIAITPTIMGPPMPMQKLNSNLNLVPIAMKSPPPLTSGGLSFAASTKSSTPASNSIKTTTQHTSAAVLSTASLSMVNYKQSKVLLAHVKPTNLSDIKIETTTSAATPLTAKSTATPANSLVTEKPKTSSLREFRLPSRESAPDILDLSPSTKAATNGLTEKLNIQTPATTNSVTTTASNSLLTSGSTLEMALNKIKQNMSTANITTTSSTTVNHIPSVANSNALDNGIKKPELAASSSSPISDDLQNLHLLSESATAREKIAIGTVVTTSTTSSPYEKVKITQNTLVRQQNASVRNIPNPSALAFRNQQPVSIMPPMVTIAAGVANKLNDLDKPLLLKTPSPPKSPYSLSCSTASTSASSTSSTSPSRSTTNKKHHPSIDQVAASLNMRASAAAEASAKAHSKLSDETALVTSTSSSSMDGKQQQIKVETGEIAVKQNDATSPVLPSSTTTTTVNTIVEIKKEPDEKIDDSSDMKVVGGFVNASTAATTTVTANKTSMVENLVTSVINVTTPTTKLFTAASSVGY